MQQRLRSIAFQLFLLLLVEAVVVDVTHGGVVIEDNGYSGVVVALDSDLPQPAQDGGLALLSNLKTILTETSGVLYRATKERSYLKSIDILLPPSWNDPIDGIDVDVVTNETLEWATMRVKRSDDVLPRGAFPWAFHSGLCGVAGNYIQMASQFIESDDVPLSVKAKAMVHQWAQYRYGVFEEYGYPGDYLLPYFYHHPQGYYALTSTNDTEIHGSLIKLNGEESCSPGDDGSITEDCRFVPGEDGQTATSSLMSFYWINSMVAFSDEETHDPKPPHRQNRLCGSKSVWQVIEKSPDFIDDRNPPVPDRSTQPEFRFRRNRMQPVLYIAVDTSSPTNDGINVGILRGGLSNLINVLLDPNPDIVIGLSTFEGIDEVGDSYLREKVSPTRVKDDVMTGVNLLQFNSDVLQRNVGAVLRDAIGRLAPYKDVGGSILYVVAHSRSKGSNILETAVAELLLNNNIHLVMVESGVEYRAAQRLATISGADYYPADQWKTTAFFRPIHQRVVDLTTNAVAVNRRAVISVKDNVSSGESLLGSFLLDDGIGSDTLFVLQFPLQGEFRVKVTTPEGQVYQLESSQSSTNWNDPEETNVGIVALDVTSDRWVGLWHYEIEYDASGCYYCSSQVMILAQVTSSLMEGWVMPSVRTWVSLTPGEEFVDVSVHPLVVSVTAETDEGSIGGLKVRADFFRDNQPVGSLALTDTGTMQSDVSQDGIYSAVYVPQEDGMYSINIVMEDTGSSQYHTLLSFNQSYLCCGSSSPTVKLPNYQVIVTSAQQVEVRNAQASKPVAPVVSDFIADVMGVDGDRIYVSFSFTEPADVESQDIKYSMDYQELMDDIDAAASVEIEYGSLEPKSTAEKVFVITSAPYIRERNVHFAVRTTGVNNLKGSSYIVWSEVHPADIDFTTPRPTTSTESTTTTPESSTTTPEPSTTTHIPSTTTPEPSTTTPEPSTTTPEPFTTPESSTTEEYSTTPETTAPEPSTTTPIHSTTPEPSTTTPEPSTTTPEPSTTTPEPSTTTPEPSTTTPEPFTTTPEPSTTTSEPSTTTSEPSTTTPEPSTTTHIPTTTTEPSTTTPEPSTTTPEPSTTTPIPSTTTPIPSTTTPEPSTTTPEPSTTTPIPSTTTPIPSTTTPEPSTTTPEPSTTTLVPSTTTPVPSTTTPEPSKTTPEPSTTTPEPPITTTEPEPIPFWTTSNIAIVAGASTGGVLLIIIIVGCIWHKKKGRRISGNINSGFDSSTPTPRHVNSSLGPRQVPMFYGAPYGQPKGEMKQLNEEEEPSQILKVFSTHNTRPSEVLKAYDNIGVTLEFEEGYLTAM